MEAHPPSILLILNPKGGSSEPGRIKVAFQKLLDSHNARGRVHETDGDDDLPRVVEGARGAGFDTVAACGGDGTVSAVANALVGTSLRLGIVPAGTANVLAKELGIPLDFEDALAALFSSGKTRRMDAMRVGKKFYFSHLSIGVYSKIAEGTDPEAKRRLGRIVYVKQYLELFRRPKSWIFRLETDGMERRIKASTVMIASAGTMGALGMKWAPDVKADAGYVSVCVLKAHGFSEYLATFWHFLRGRHAESRFVSLYPARESVFVSNPAALPVRGDGEILGHEDLRIDIHPAAVMVIVPA